MNRTSSFLNTLDKVETLEKQLYVNSTGARWFYENGNTRSAFSKALKLEETAEQLVLLTRTLPAHTGSSRARQEVEKIMCEQIPVQIGFTAEGWFSLRIPALLPKKESGSANYIRSFLYPAMQQFFHDRPHPPVRYQDCVLIFRHVYEEGRPERQRRDHDNIEVNMVTDVVALYVMPDDGPEICAHYYCSAAGLENRTEVYVVPKKDFSLWLATERAIPKEGVKLYETQKV